MSDAISLPSQLIIKTDGGARGNPGPAAWGFVALTPTQEAVYQDNKYLGTATNNEAEYQGFVASVAWLVGYLEKNPDQAQRLSHVTWQLDSKLVVEQLNKNWKIKEPRMAEYASQAWNLLSHVSCSYSIQHIPRAQNAAADALVNQALDTATLMQYAADDNASS